MMIEFARVEMTWSEISVYLSPAECVIWTLLLALLLSLPDSYAAIFSYVFTRGFIMFLTYRFTAAEGREGRNITKQTKLYSSSQQQGNVVHYF